MRVYAVMEKLWGNSAPFVKPSLDLEDDETLTYNQMVVDTRTQNPRAAGRGAEVSDERTDELTNEQVDRMFRALADQTRRDIVARSLRREASVSELALSYEMSFAAVQKHVAVLERAGLVSKRAEGRERKVIGNPEAIRRANALLGEYQEIWRSRISRLDALLSEQS